MHAFVYSADGSRYGEWWACVNELAGDWTITALVTGDDDMAAKASHFADEVLHIPMKPGHLIEDVIPTAQAKISEAKPDLFLTGAAVSERILAVNIAARFHADVSFKAASIPALTEGKITVVSAQATLASPGDEQAAAGVITKVELLEEAGSVKLIEVQPKEKLEQGFANADRVVGVGLGFKTEEDIALAQKLVDAIHGALGCSRPIVQALKPLTKLKEWIGVSGDQISAQLYIPIAISGQIQHLLGIKGVKEVVAINKDPKAPIFDHCDYGIVADYHEAIPAILKALDQAS